MQLAQPARRRRGGARSGCRTPSRRSGRGAGCRRCGRCGRQLALRRRADVTSLAMRGASGREPPPDAAHQTEGEVLADPLVPGVGQPRLRRGRLVRAPVALDLAAAAAAGHPVQLEVVDGGGLLGEPVEHVVEHLDRLAGVQPERGDALQRDLGDDAEGAEADAGDAQQLRVVSSSSAARPHRRRSRAPCRRRSSPGCRAPSPVPWVAVAMAPAIDWRSMSPRLGMARPAAASSSFSARRRMPPPAPSPGRDRRSTSSDPGHGVERRPARRRSPRPR